MALSQGSSFWDGRYRELATLPLPGPALVIDVRQGTEHEPPLVWNLATELDDFTQEMELQHVYRWRRLGYYLALFKLNPLPPRNLDRATCDYVLTDPRGASQVLQGQVQLAEALREKVGLVRDNRIGAVNDREQRFSTEPLIDPDRPTVHVCFVADAEDPNSLTSAATYAEWLKQADHHYDKQWSWRTPRLKTMAICLNVDPYRHSPRMLTDYFRRNLDLPFALDKTILLHRYGDNNIVINTEMQTHQVELILYVLLLCGLEMLDTHSSERYNPSIEQEEDGRASDSWSVDLIGISSLEYSARWGTRWLDYGLVARISQILLNPVPDQSMEPQHYSVHREWLAWQTDVQHFVRNEFQLAFPSLQVLFELPTYLAPQSAKKRASANWPDDLQALVWQIAQRYTGDRDTLADTLDSVPMILDQLRRVPRRGQLAGHTEVSTELRQRWQELLARAAQLPSALLLSDALGQSSFPLLDVWSLLPRASQSATILSNTIRDIAAIAQDPPDLAACRVKLEEAAARWQQRLQYLRHRKRQNQYEQSRKQLTELVRQHTEQVQNVIVAQTMLALLQTVGLYDPSGKPSCYQLRLLQLTNMLRQVQREALSMQEKAYDRLQLSLSQMQVSPLRGTIRLNLHSRVDLLDWPALDKAFAQLSEDLAALDSSLPLLGYWLLCLLSEADPELLMQQLQNHHSPTLTTFEQDQTPEKQALREIGTLLVAILLLSKQMQVPATRMQTLVDKYVDLVRHLDVEPSAFINIMERLQREGRPRRPGQVQKDSLADFAIRLEESPPLLLATWVNSGYVDHPQLSRVLARNGILARMAADQIKPDAIFADLRKRNILSGYPAPMLGEDSAYLLLAPGDISKQFLQEINRLQVKHQPHIFPFPDIEKLVYLRVHHIDYRLEDDLPPVSLPSPDPV